MREMTTLMQFLQRIQAGDVLIMRGTTPLDEIIQENWMHVAIAISQTQAYHVAERGYEIIDLSKLLDKKVYPAVLNARFEAVGRELIVREAIQLAQNKAFSNRIGNVFSSSKDRKTQNCAELVQQIYKKAILDAFVKANKDGLSELSSKMWKTYFEDHKVKELGPTNRVQNDSLINTFLLNVAREGVEEFVKGTYVENHKTYKPNVEVTRKKKYDETSGDASNILRNKIGNLVTLDLIQIDFYSPKTFLRSPYFRAIAKLERDRKRSAAPSQSPSWMATTENAERRF